MKVLDKLEYDDWKSKQSDAYSMRIFTYAEDWANLLEKEIESSGNTPEQVIKEKAEKFSHDADTDGITGFMFGASVSVLARCWIHGEILRKWHNLNTQTNGEGEKANEKEGAVLNPAILHVE